MSVEGAKTHIIDSFERLDIAINESVPVISLSSELDWDAITADEFNAALADLKVSGHIEILTSGAVKRLK